MICMFGIRKSAGFPDEIELMVAWDEYCVDGNGDGFEEACKEEKKSWGSDLGETRMIEIEVDESAIQERFKASTLKGEVK